MLSKTLAEGSARRTKPSQEAQELQKQASAPVLASENRARPKLILDQSDRSSEAIFIRVHLRSSAVACRSRAVLRVFAPFAAAILCWTGTAGERRRSLGTADERR